MVDELGRKASSGDTENLGAVDYVNLPPNYEQTSKWFGDRLVGNEFESYEAARRAMGSFIEQIRYLAQTDMEALQRVIDHFAPREGMRVGAVITADGTKAGRLMADDTIEIDPDPYEEMKYLDDPSLQDTIPQELLDLDQEAFHEAE